MRKPTRSLVALMLTMALAATVTACGSSTSPGKSGGAITLSQSAAPDFLDPALAYSVEAASAHWLIYPGLLTYKHAEGKEGAKLIPAAAEGMPKISDGGKTYTFKLRPGLKYSDGTPAKASDFEHAVQRLLTLQWGGLSFFEVIKGVDAYIKADKPGADISGITSNEKTREITVHLKHPDGRFEYIVAFPSAGLVPGKTSFKNLSNSPPPGLGSYKFGKIDPGRQYVMTKNRTFRLPGIPAGKVDKITVKIVKSPAKQTQDVISGKVDGMFDPPATDLLPEVRTKYADRFDTNTSNSAYYMFLNTRTKPFDDVRVRDAVNYALDKRAMVRIFGGLLDADCNLLPPGMAGYKKIDPCPYGDPSKPPDLAKAKKLIADAGAQGTKVKVWGDDEERTSKITQYYADVLNKIGLKAEPNIVGSDNYLTVIGNEKTNAQTGFFSWGEDFPHPSSFFSLVDGKSIVPTNNSNVSYANDPAVNKAAAEIQRLPAEAGAAKSAALDRLVTGPSKALVAPYGHAEDTSFVSERMNSKDCTVYSPVYRDDWSQLCLK